MARQYVKKSSTVKPQSEVIDVEIAQVLQPLFDTTHDVSAIFGGRGSSKSWAVALYLLSVCSREHHKVLCCREFQKNIKDSVHALLVDLNRMYGFGFVHTKTELSHPITESIFTFDGLSHNEDAIKGLSNYSKAWVEEAATVSEASFDSLFPTIRGGDHPEVIIVFNPRNESDYTYQKFVKPFLHTINNSPDSRFTGTLIDGGTNYWVQKVNFNDNPWFPEALRKQAVQDMHSDPDKFRHVWLGEPLANVDNVVFRGEWLDAATNAHNHPIHKELGTFDSDSDQWKMGYDPADGGKDKHAYTIRQGRIIRKIETWNGELRHGLNIVHQAVRDYKVSEIAFDAIGVGASVGDILADKYGGDKYRKTLIKGNKSPSRPWAEYKSGVKNKDAFKNRRAQAYITVANLLRNTWESINRGVVFDQNDLISFDKDCGFLDQLRVELLSVRLKPNDSGLLQIESKLDMKKKRVASPNTADSLIYAIAANALQHSNIVHNLNGSGNQGYF